MHRRPEKRDLASEKGWILGGQIQPEDNKMNKFLLSQPYQINFHPNFYTNFLLHHFSTHTLYLSVILHHTGFSAGNPGFQVDCKQQQFPPKYRTVYLEQYTAFPRRPEGLLFFQRTQRCCLKRRSWCVCSAVLLAPC